jgi:hypothetical protein
MLAVAAATAACARHAPVTPAAAAPSGAAPLASGQSSGPGPAPATTSSSSATAGPNGAPAGPAGAAVPSCPASALEARFRVTGGDSTRRSGSVGFHNQGKTACTLSGFPDLQLLGRGDDPISTSVVRDGARPGVIRLAPGQTAWAAVTWTAVAAADEPRSGPCQPAAVRLAVFPPAQLTQLSTDYTAGVVCDHGRFVVSPLADVS